jgi:hypothetical protein
MNDLCACANTGCMRLLALRCIGAWGGMTANDASRCPAAKQ